MLVKALRFTKGTAASGTDTKTGKAGATFILPNELYRNCTVEYFDDTAIITDLEMDFQFAVPTNSFMIVKQ